MKELKTHIDSGRKWYSSFGAWKISLCGLVAPPKIAKQGEQPTCKICARKVGK